MLQPHRMSGLRWARSFGSGGGSTRRWPLKSLVGGFASLGESSGKALSSLLVLRCTSASFASEGRGGMISHSHLPRYHHQLCMCISLARFLHLSVRTGAYAGPLPCAEYRGASFRNMLES